MKVLHYILAALICLVAGCVCHSESRATLDRAEALMQECPDSALALLRGVDSVDLRSDEEKARYALLFSQALDKNYIDTTDFEVLQPAIDYYSNHGTADEKLRTLYYKGCIYLNRREYDKAMEAYILALETDGNITDSITLAHTLVAQATLFYRQYKPVEFAANNLKAAPIYHNTGKVTQEMKSYANAIDAAVILDDRNAADSLLSIAEALLHDYPETVDRLMPAVMSYTLTFGEESDIYQVIETIDEDNMSTDLTFQMANALNRIDRPVEAIAMLDSMVLSSNLLDSLKFYAIKSDALEKIGDYREALRAYKMYSNSLELHNRDLFSQDLLFAQKKHDMEKDILKAETTAAKTRQNAILIVLICAAVAIIIYYVYRGEKARRMIARIENGRLTAEKHAAEAERDRMYIALRNVELEKTQLEKERDRLMEIMDELKTRIPRMTNEETSTPNFPDDLVRKAIRERVDVLNGLIAKEITRDVDYEKPYMDLIESIEKNRIGFVDNTRLAFSVAYPEFIRHLENCGCTNEEINHACMYAIGLRGKEIGTFFNLKSHYNISSSIRKKLGLGDRDRNLGPYLRHLLENS